MKYYRVDEATLRELVRSAHFGDALMNGGVDNWIGYDEARSDYLDACSDIDRTEYEDFNALVQHDLALFDECKCGSKGSVLDTFLDCLGQMPLQ